LDLTVEKYCWWDLQTQGIWQVGNALLVEAIILSSQVRSLGERGSPLRNLCFALMARIKASMTASSLE
jgi:hypothetical protein